ncbi:hypothetical protein [Ruegeria sp. EL01]|uniref:hypothetical protein n=1 Tax=Ruegeria sp. EL01 TaxID=2107578 RepID=UPI0013C4071B|nr:hypothetical protein [Ruegeria sp. EL01]
MAYAAQNDDDAKPALVEPPDDTRQTLTRLMTRLMVEHAGAVDGGMIMKHEKIKASDL